MRKVVRIPSCLLVVIVSPLDVVSLFLEKKDGDSSNVASMRNEKMLPCSIVYSITVPPYMQCWIMVTYPPRLSLIESCSNVVESHLSMSAQGMMEIFRRRPFGDYIAILLALPILSTGNLVIADACKAPDYILYP